MRKHPHDSKMAKMQVKMQVKNAQSGEAYSIYPDQSWHWPILWEEMVVDTFMNSASKAIKKHDAKS